MPLESVVGCFTDTVRIVLPFRSGVVGAVILPAQKTHATDGAKTPKPTEADPNIPDRKGR